MRIFRFAALVLPLLAAGCRSEPLPPETGGPNVERRATDVQSPPPAGVEATPAQPQPERPPDAGN